MAEPDDLWFEREKQVCESKYLAGTNPRQQSGFGRDERDWERYRRPVVAGIHGDGTFLDIGCANGLLMESVVRWAAEDGHEIQPYGLDISERLVALARRRLPQWGDRIFVGNALYWNPPGAGLKPGPYDFVRTELVYVPVHRRREYGERLLERVVAAGGRLIICSYGSSRPEGIRSESLLDELDAWALKIGGVNDVVSREHGFVITRAVWTQR